MPKKPRKISPKPSDLMLLWSFFLFFYLTCELLTFLFFFHHWTSQNTKSNRALLEGQPSCCPAETARMGRGGGVHLFTKTYSATMHSLICNCRHDIKDYEQTTAGIGTCLRFQRVESRSLERAPPSRGSTESDSACSRPVISARVGSVHLHFILGRWRERKGCRGQGQANEGNSPGPKT